MSPATLRLARRMGIAIGMNTNARRVTNPMGGGHRYRLPFLGGDFALCARIHGWVDA